MASQLFMIGFNASERLLSRRIHAFVTTVDQVQHWWNHLPGLFLVETEVDARELAKSLRKWLGDSNIEFVVMKVDPVNSSGFLAGDAAEWIERRQFALQQQSMVAR